MSQPKRILKQKEVQAMTALSRSTIYEMMKNKDFPQSVKLGSHRVGWVESEVQEWIDYLIEARDTDTKAF